MFLVELCVKRKLKLDITGGGHHKILVDIGGDPEQHY